ncbi:MAG: hypothetical protein P8N94_15705 [Gammaproteobacteria bacterium]|nr:hypothetical protein [Gammaproteobacteria bacterium]
MRTSMYRLSISRASAVWRVLPCLALAILGAVLVTSPALAQQPNDSELGLIELDSSTENDQLDSQQRAREGEIAQELSLRRQAIDELQGSQGIYAPELQEAYGDLASLFEEMDDFESAIAVYFDALQISRINTGLYSDQQLPIIQSLIEGNSQLRNWEATDDLQELRYHISTRLYDLADLAYLEAAENYGAWKLRLLRQNLLDLSYRSYSGSAEELSEFYERLLLNLEVQPNFRAAKKIDVLQGKSEADLILVRAIATTPYTAFEGTVSRYINQQRCRNVRSASGQVVRECVSVQVENPRYRQSQRDAKRFALNRRTRAVQDSIDMLKQIYERSDELGSREREQLEAQIAELETETFQLLRQSRSRRLF